MSDAVTVHSNEVIGSTVLRDLAGGVLTVTLNRPDAANALRAQEREALIALLHEAHVTPEIRVVVLAATGRQFCAGADVAGIQQGPGADGGVGHITRRIMGGAQALISAVLDCDKPVVASVQGAAAGMGAHLVFASDLVVASENASFIESFVLRGLVVDAGGAYLLPRRIGLQKAKELVMLGGRLPASDARELGLVNRVVPADELVPATLDLAQRLAAAPTTAVSLTKRLFNASLDGGREASYAAEAMAQELQSHAEDSAEGVRAFMERREPTYKGR